MFLLLLAAALVTPAFSTMPANAFKKHEVVPDVIPTAPEKLIKVSFKSGVEVQLCRTDTIAKWSLGRPRQCAYTATGEGRTGCELGCRPGHTLYVGQDR